MSKKTTDRKAEKQTGATKPVVLKDDELGVARGGFSGGVRVAQGVVIGPSHKPVATGEFGTS